MLLLLAIWVNFCCRLNLLSRNPLRLPFLHCQKLQRRKKTLILWSLGMNSLTVKRIFQKRSFKSPHPQWASNHLLLTPMRMTQWVSLLVKGNQVLSITAFSYKKQHSLSTTHGLFSWECIYNSLLVACQSYAFSTFLVLKLELERFAAVCPQMYLVLYVYVL